MCRGHDPWLFHSDSPESLWPVLVFPPQSLLLPAPTCIFLQRTVLGLLEPLVSWTAGSAWEFIALSRETFHWGWWVGNPRSLDSIRSHLQSRTPLGLGWGWDFAEIAHLLGMSSCPRPTSHFLNGSPGNTFLITHLSPNPLSGSAKRRTCPKIRCYYQKKWGWERLLDSPKQQRSTIMMQTFPVFPAFPSL